MTTTIRNMRAIGAADDPLLLRLRLEQALSAADLHVPGMPPAAILCVRRLPDPLPGRLDLNALMPQRAWEQAMRAALERMAQCAARPALGPPPPNTPAVWFEDRAELLACLARDWCTGTLAARWWWRTLLHDRGAHAGDLNDRLYAAWRATRAAIPAALALLHDRGAGAHFLALLPLAEVRALSRHVATTFGLPVLERTHDVIPAHQRREVPPTTAAALAMLDHAADVRVLDPERRALYAAGVLLARAPMLARAAWPVAIERWANTESPGRTVGHPPLPEAPDTLPLPHAAKPPRPYSAEPVPEQMQGVASDAATDPVAHAAPALATQLDSDTTPAALPEIASPAPPVAAVAPNAAVTRLLAPRDADQRLAEPLQTRFGGMLLLINLALHLDLYSDFTRPLHAGIGLSPWALLALLGPHLLPAAAPDDPLWALLADLAGAAPEVGFIPPRIWRVPRAWLEPFGVPACYQIAHRSGWLQLAHPTGFAVLEQRRPLSRRRSESIGPPVRRFAGSRRGINRIVHQLQAARALPFAAPPDTLAGWIERLACYAQARLALALGGADEVARTLALPARIYASDVRLDVMFSLNELPIAVRLAGLDRNPGWVPAAGRDIRFHFE
ncbi:MAG: hypothetical protein H7Z42_05530 [Roseiflexaceae bacterium]|nr:hypothetical protein [Roseiflexaceae bacterium]